jgi:hypothetical protein
LHAARRGGKLRAQADSVNSGYADNQPRSLFVAASPNLSPFGSHEVFCNTPFRFFAPTRALHFRSQENFFAGIENKIHFFLVAFSTDF